MDAYTYERTGPSAYTLKDSGKRDEYPTGAVRDRREGKGRFDLLPLAGIRRLAQVFERGCNKYGERNWEKGMPVSRYLDSAIRHTLQYLDGHVDEDHLGQAAWNLIAALSTEEWIDEGRLSRDLLPESRRLYVNEADHAS